MMAAVNDETNTNPSNENDNGFTIRPMRADDYPALIDLWTHCTGMGINSVDDTEESIARFIECNPTTCLVAEETAHAGRTAAEPAEGEGETPAAPPAAPPAATASPRLLGAILAGTDGRRAYVYHTAVAPVERGRGIGTALVDAMLDAFRRLGIVRAKLVAIRTNEAGNAFWERHGFHERPDLTYREADLLPTRTIMT